MTEEPNSSIEVSPPTTAEGDAASTTGDSSIETPLPAIRRPTLSELALGGVLIVSENVGSRLQVPQETAEPASRSLEMVLRPAAEWDTASPTSLAAARRVTVGLLSDARNGAGRSGSSLFETTDALGRALDRITRPVRQSRILRPARGHFHRYEQRGEQQMARWEAIGRQEEARSRAVAEASLGGFLQRSVSDLTESEQIQVLVHQVVESQSTGLAKEMVKEIRERMVSLDILLARKTRPANTTELVEPSFRRAYLQSHPTLTAIGSVDQTMAGRYAGFASRAAAFFVDVTLLMIALSLATTFANALVGLFNLDGLISRLMGSTTFTGTITAAIAGLAGSIFVVTYGVLSWNLNGRTIGDSLIGVRVLQTGGGRVPFGHAVIRILGAYIAGVFLFLGFFWAIFDSRRQGWHDKLAGTVVIYDWPAVPDEQFLREELGMHSVLPRQQPTP